jgi:hypothetical protein
VLAQIPKGVWALGFVSLLMDVSSEMVHSLLPMFMATMVAATAPDDLRGTAYGCFNLVNGLALLGLLIHRPAPEAPA